MRAESSHEIDAVAAKWVARIDRGVLSSDEEARLESWLQGDTRRRGAFMRLQAIAIHTERAAALGRDFEPDNFREDDVAPADPLDAPEVDAASSLITRRRVLWLGGSAVAACATGAVGLRSLLDATRYDTRIGEVKVVTLEDGSVMTLNTASRAAVRFNVDRRLISLENGEALFDVAKNHLRPFIVEAGGTQVRAVGTSFTVKHLSDSPVEVLVKEGIVDVSSDNAAQPIRMVANTRILATPQAPDAPIAPAHVTPDEMDRDMAWQSGRIALEGQTLDEAAVIFARYSDTKIVIADASVGREEISGLFTANDPVTFARAAAASLDLKAEVGQGQVTISR